LLFTIVELRVNIFASPQGGYIRHRQHQRHWLKRFKNAGGNAFPQVDRSLNPDAAAVANQRQLRKPQYPRQPFNYP
jgi:hypothetical protein